MPQQSWRRDLVWGRRWLCFMALATFPPAVVRTSPDNSKFFLHNGKIVHGKKQKYEPGDNITIECQPGYALNGPREIRYVGGGKWLPVHPRCYLNAFFTLLITVLVFIALFLLLEMLYRKWKSGN